LPESAADTLVDTICDHTARFVVFTAAREWFGGDHHVNCREPEYWIEKFTARGFTHEVDFRLAASPIS
jgi:hypothetical protein